MAHIPQGGPVAQTRVSPRVTPYDLRNSANSANSSPPPRFAIFGSKTGSTGSGSQFGLYSPRTSSSLRATAPASPQVAKRSSSSGKLSVGRLSNGGVLSSPGHNTSRVSSTSHARRPSGGLPHNDPSHGPPHAAPPSPRSSQRDLSRDAEARERMRCKFTDALENSDNAQALQTAKRVRLLLRHHLGMRTVREIGLVPERPSSAADPASVKASTNGTSESLGTFLQTLHDPDILSTSEEEDNVLFAPESQLLASTVPANPKKELPPALLRSLSEIPMGRDALQMTGVGRSLARHFRNSASLVEKWTKRVRHGVRLGFELEAALFEKYADIKTSSVPQKDQRLWRYHQDCRSAISTLRRDFNAELRTALLEGRKSVGIFLTELEREPDKYANPANREAQEGLRAERDKKRKSGEPDDSKMQSLADEFPFVHEKMECIACGQKDKGCRYGLLYYDAWGGYRARENTRTVLYKCVECGAQWTRDE